MIRKQGSETQNEILWNILSKTASNSMNTHQYYEGNTFMEGSFKLASIVKVDRWVTDLIKGLPEV